MADDKLAKLQSRIRSLESCIVAYSGGVDSAFLAVVAHQTIGARSLAAIADSPSLPRQELENARKLAADFGFALTTLQTEEFAQEEYLANPNNRCYFCKAELFRKLTALAGRRGYSTILYGENASDSLEERPGRTAATEFQILAPLREAGLTKSEIRNLSRELGLPTAEQPAQPCLSSRIPRGERVTTDKLRAVETGEQTLRDFGFREFRVRLHELGQGYLARVEISPDEWPRLLHPELRNNVGKELRKAGFEHVALDLFGYGNRAAATGRPLPANRPE